MRPTNLSKDVVHIVARNRNEKTFTISLRTATGWRKQENISKNHCDIDGAKLWIAPHGGVYCDCVHE